MSENITTEHTCAGCQAAMDEDAVFCNECGLAHEAVKADTKVCPRCGKEIKRENKFCPACAFNFFQPVQESSTSLPPPAKTAPLAGTDASWPNSQPDAPGDQVAALNRRYKDGYRVAAAIEGFGVVLKVGGPVVGGLIVFIGLMVGSAAVQASRNSMFGSSDGGLGAFIWIMFLFGMIGGIVAVIAWIFGVMLSAQGQVLKANLDCAVNSSPFLTDLSKAEIMSLPSS